MFRHQVYSGSTSSDHQSSMKIKEGRKKRPSTQDVRHISNIPVWDNDGHNSQPSSLSNSQSLFTVSEEREHSNDNEQEEFLQDSNFGRHTGHHIRPYRSFIFENDKQRIEAHDDQHRPYKVSRSRLSNPLNAGVET